MRSDRRRVSSRRVSSQGQFFRTEKGIIHHTRKGRVRDASIGIATCHWPNDVSSTAECVLIWTLNPKSYSSVLLNTKTYVGYFINSEGPVYCCRCRIKSLNGGRREQRALGQGYAAGDKYSMRILWRRYFILYTRSIVSGSHLRDVPERYYTKE